MLDHILEVLLEDDKRAPKALLEPIVFNYDTKQKSK